MSIVAGSLQDSINKYREAYLHAQELGLQIRREKGIYFFNDYVLDYVRRIATIKVYDNIYNVYNVYNTLFNEQE
jgi:carbohydrate diacid regulator